MLWTDLGISPQRRHPYPINVAAAGRPRASGSREPGGNGPLVPGSGYRAVEGWEGCGPVAPPLNNQPVISCVISVMEVTSLTAFGPRLTQNYAEVLQVAQCLYMCMYACIHVHVYMYIHITLYTCAYMYVHVHIYAI